jgi:TolB-like protein/Flp pilus assembly protein TadD
MPAELDKIIGKALEKDAGKRYASGKEILDVLGTVSLDSPLAEATEKKSIVVLPFENMSPDPEQDYFCDGMTEENIADLSKIQSLRVISRTSSMMLKGSKKDMHTVAREVNVQYVLEGSVRKAGNRLRITAQLIDALNDAHLWAEKYSGTLDDVFEIQEEVSGSIVDALKLTLSPEEKRKMGERPIRNSTAYEWYLRATGAASRYTEDSLVEALRYFEHALDAIGTDALIYSGMADTYLRLVNVGVEIDRNRKKAEELANKALELDPEMPKARALLGQLGIWYAGGNVNLREAARQFKRALAVDPVEPVALLGLGCVYFWAGRISAAASLGDRLRQIEPLDVIALVFQGFRYFYDGHYDRALQVFRNLYEQDPRHPGSMSLSTWQHFYALSLAYKQRTDEALAIIGEAAATNPDNVQTRLAIMLGHALRGDKQKALQQLNPYFYEWCRRDPTWSHRIACDFAYLNAKDEALDWLENAVNLGHINYPLFTEKDLFLANLRGDPRFEQLMQRVKREYEEFEV